MWYLWPHLFTKECHEQTRCIRTRSNQNMKQRSLSNLIFVTTSIHKRVIQCPNCSWDWENSKFQIFQGRFQTVWLFEDS
jgi:hypothetical protein